MTVGTVAQVTPTMGGVRVDSGDSMGTVGVWEGTHSTPFVHQREGPCGEVLTVHGTGWLEVSSRPCMKGSLGWAEPEFHLDPKP